MMHGSHAVNHGIHRKLQI